MTLRARPSIPATPGVVLASPTAALARSGDPTPGAGTACPGAQASPAIPGSSRPLSLLMSPPARSCRDLRCSAARPRAHQLGRCRALDHGRPHGAGRSPAAVRVGGVVQDRGSAVSQREVGLAMLRGVPVHSAATAPRTSGR